MNPEIEKQLQNEHPTIFKKLGGDPSETCMAWGCDHGPGWRDLLTRLCRFISAMSSSKWHIKKATGPGFVEVAAPKVVFEQVKEKFGTLRIYFSLENPPLPPEVVSTIDHESYRSRVDSLFKTIHGAISFAEYMSSSICEQCGAPGHLDKTGWWKTLCEEHTAARHTAKSGSPSPAPYGGEGL